MEKKFSKFDKEKAHDAVMGIWLNRFNAVNVIIPFTSGFRTLYAKISLTDMMKHIQVGDSPFV